MENFNDKMDKLYVRIDPVNNSPFEYLYIHIDEDDSANFCAYFKSLEDQTPIVYKFDRINIEGWSNNFGESDNMLKKILIDNDDIVDKKDRPWEIAKSKNMIINSTWKYLFQIIINKIKK